MTTLLKSYKMNYRIEVLRTFKKKFKRLSKRYPSLISDLLSLKDDILENPSLGVDIGGGLRKIRMRISSKGKGKSGGARVITLNVIVATNQTEINLLYIYDKSERESRTRTEIEEILRKCGL